MKRGRAVRATRHSKRLCLRPRRKETKSERKSNNFRRTRAVTRSHARKEIELKSNLEKLRRFLEENKDPKTLNEFEAIVDKIYHKPVSIVKFQLLDRLEETSCLYQCLDYLTARELATLACCSSGTNRMIAKVTSLRIKRVVGEPSWRQVTKQSIVPYIKGLKARKRVRKNIIEDLSQMRVVDLRKQLKQHGSSTKGKKTELIQKLSEIYKLRNRRDLKYLWEREYLQPFYVSQWVDVEDTTSKWLEAQIIAIDGTNVAIHYKGWKTKYDEWLDLSRGSPDWHRIARPLSRFKEHPPHLPKHRKFVQWLKCGYIHKFTEPVLMVHDTTEKWVEASVIGYRTWSPNCSQVRVTYHGWDKKYDEWIDVQSYRLAPRPSFLSPDAYTPAPTGVPAAGAGAAEGERAPEHNNAPIDDERIQSLIFEEPIDLGAFEFVNPVQAPAGAPAIRAE